MNRLLFRCGVAVALCLTGCSTPPRTVRFVPTSTVRRVQPQPATFAEFRDAEQRGDSVVAAENSLAWGADDRPIRLEPGERLHPVTFNRSSGRIVARRLDDSSLVSLSPDGLEVLTTTYPP